MKRKGLLTQGLLLAAFSLTLLNGCTGPKSPPVLFRQASRPVSKGTLSRVEQLVDPERMQKNMASLTGKTPFLPNTLIPERGTVEGRALTRQFLTVYLESLGYKVERHEYRKNGINIMTRLMADEPTDEYIVVGAHLDSVRNAGADDNGSGSTAVLEAASVLPQLGHRKVNILFAWFDEEELGLIGSSYLTRDFKKQGLKISSAHTIDMLGWDSDGDRAVELARPDGILWDYYQMVNQTHGFKLPLDRTNTGQSDHVSFHNAGFPSLCVSEEYTSDDFTPHYHKKTDTYPTIDFNYLTSGTRLVIAAVADLSQKVPPPPNIQLIPHERFPSREREFHQSYDEHID
ncbi:MAG TPA: M28 family peptidase [Candidatus Obscuribacterales bacterium]